MADDDLNIERLLDRNKSLCEVIKRYEVRKLEDDNKSKFDQTEKNRVLIDIHKYAILARS